MKPHPNPSTETGSPVLPRIFVFTCKFLWAVCEPKSFGDDGIAQRANMRDLDFSRVTGLHPERGLSIRADAARRARADNVARNQLGESGAVGNQLGHAEYHVGKFCALDLLSVDPCR
jgi:hypothetical protein